MSEKSAKSDPVFADLAISCPNFAMRMKATPERVSRIIKFMLSEGLKAEAEHGHLTQPKTSTTQIPLDSPK